MGTRPPLVTPLGRTVDKEEQPANIVAVWMQDGRLAVSAHTGTTNLDIGKHDLGEAKLVQGSMTRGAVHDAVAHVQGVSLGKDGRALPARIHGGCSLHVSRPSGQGAWAEHMHAD